MASQPVPPPLPPRRERFGRKRKSRTWLWLLLLLLAASLATAAVFIIRTAANIDETLDEISVDPAPGRKLPKEELAREKPLAVLLLGVDNRPGIGGLNTDVIMVAALNPNDGDAVVVSIPRDTYVKVPGWSAHKANAFYAIAYDRDNLAATLAEVREVFGNFLDIPIDYAVVVNFTAFERIVDAVGGVEVYVDQDMRYVDPTDGTNINLKKGKQVLDGKKALDFVRYRHSNNGETPDSNDFERNRRQQEVLAALAGKMKSVSALLKVNELLDALGANMHTDLPRQQMESLLKTYAGFSGDKLTAISLKGTWVSPYVYLDEEQFAEAIELLKEQLTP